MLVIFIINFEIVYFDQVMFVLMEYVEIWIIYFQKKKIVFYINLLNINSIFHLKEKYLKKPVNKSSNQMLMQHQNNTLVLQQN